MLKIKKIQKDGKYLKVYFKRPRFKNLKVVLDSIDSIFNDEDNYLGTSLESTGKYIIMTLILRNKEDILPYIVGKGRVIKK
jgi:hypothetical protein